MTAIKKYNQNKKKEDGKGGQALWRQELLRKYQFVFFFALSLLAAMLLTSCQLLDNISEYNLPKATSGAEKEETTKEAVPPSDFTKTEIALIVSTMPNLNPYAAQNSSAELLLRQCYQGLMTMSVDGKMTPQLADEVILADDAMSCQVILGNKQFHDGSPVRFQDIHYSWQKAKASPYAADVQVIKKITATGENQFQIEFQSAGVLNLYSLTFPIVENNGLGNGDLYPINGTGPYRLIDYKRKQSMHLQSEQNKLAITLSRTEGTEKEAFLNGLTDVYFTSEFPWFSFSGETLRNIFKFPGHYFYYMGFQTKGLSADANIRRYLMSKLDQELLYKNAFLNHMIKQTIPYYRGKEWESELTQLPAANGKNVLDVNPIPSGQKLVLLYPAEDHSLSIMAQNIKEEWEAYIGIEPVGLAEAEYTAALQAGQFDVYLAKMPVRQYPNLPELFGSTGRYNFAGAPGLDGAVTAFMQAATEADLKQAYVRLATQVTESQWLIPFGFVENAVIISDQVSGTLSPKTYDALHGISELKPVQSEEKNGKK